MEKDKTRRERVKAKLARKGDNGNMEGKVDGEANVIAQGGDDENTTTKMVKT